MASDAPRLDPRGCMPAERPHLFGNLTTPLSYVSASLARAPIRGVVVNIGAYLPHPRTAAARWNEDHAWKFALQHGSVRVVAFEPDPAHYNETRHVVRRMGSRVTLVNEYAEPRTICARLAALGVRPDTGPRTLDDELLLVKLDVDSIDYAVASAVATCYRPHLWIVEHNAWVPWQMQFTALPRRCTPPPLPCPPAPARHAPAHAGRQTIPSPYTKRASADSTTYGHVGARHCGRGPTLSARVTGTARPPSQHAKRALRPAFLVRKASDPTCLIWQVSNPHIRGGERDDDSSRRVRARPRARQRDVRDARHAIRRAAISA